jgi:hypothetical protein
LEPIQFKYLFATFQAKLKKGELSKKRRLVEDEPSPEEIMDAIQVQEALGARQAEDDMIEQTRAIGGGDTESTDHLSGAIWKSQLWLWMNMMNMWNSGQSPLA